jgi:hypothetical protein
MFKQGSQRHARVVAAFTRLWVEYNMLLKR